MLLELELQLSKKLLALPFPLLITFPLAEDVSCTLLRQANSLIGLLSLPLKLQKPIP
jgi:hypothetical protein